VFAKNAVLGPIKSKAGEYLTGVVIRRNLETSPTPENLVTAPPPESPEDASRSMAAGFEPAGIHLGLRGTGVAQGPAGAGTGDVADRRLI